MLRKTSALAFMLVMTLLITLKHPVLGYCLCVGSYFTDNCTCEVVTQVASTPADCADCCADNTQSVAESPKPCEDCTQRLNIDVSDFVWHATGQLPALDQHNFPDPADYFTDSYLLAASTMIPANTPIRGDPPLWASADLDVSQGLPIYLRHSVLIL